jgi:hypothetical protein
MCVLHCSFSPKYCDLRISQLNWAKNCIWESVRELEQNFESVLVSERPVRKLGQAFPICERSAFNGVPCSRCKLEKQARTQIILQGFGFIDIILVFPSWFSLSPRLFPTSAGEKSKCRSKVIYFVIGCSNAKLLWCFIFQWSLLPGISHLRK